MRYRFLKCAWTLAAVLPTLAMAQQPPPVHREGSWELSLGGGVMLLDGTLRDFLGSRPADERFANSASPGRLAPTVVARLGYNFTRNLGFSVSGGGAMGSGVTYLTPTAALTYTVNLNARTSPFLLIGTGLTRISGENERVTHSTWGLHAGLGIRHFVSDNLALRLEGRMPFEGYDLDNDPTIRSRSTVSNPVITLGISYFVGGRQPSARAAACPACPRAVTRVDTVRVYVPFATRPPPAIVLRDTLVLEGVNFAFDESVLTPESQEVLNRVALALLESQWSNVRFEVAGHTSSIGTTEYNMALSERRAEAVRAYLVSRGVTGGRMTARGYGETQPVFPNDSEGRAWQNRRVELRRTR
jgi:outer membrane protein OmpA-like peptidoglycan-associated protein/opacity protein-like surface antigen